MPRTKNGVAHRQRVKKVLKAARGYIGRRSKIYHTAKEAVMRAMASSYKDRKRRKRDFRRLWITRINGALIEHNLKYSRFIHGLNKAGIIINRKVLSNLAIEDKPAFDAIVAKAKQALDKA